jgi:hypothetical protein
LRLICVDSILKTPSHGNMTHWLFEQNPSKIARKVGLTSATRLRWLVEDFTARLNYSALPADVTPATIAREAGAFLLYQAGPGAFDMTELPELPPAVLQKLANEVSEGLDAFIEGRPWTKRITQTDRTIQRADDNLGRNHYHALLPVRRGFPLMFTLAVMDLLI